MWTRLTVATMICFIRQRTKFVIRLYNYAHSVRVHYLVASLRLCHSVTSIARSGLSPIPTRRYVTVHPSMLRALVIRGREGGYPFTPLTPSFSSHTGSVTNVLPKVTSLAGRFFFSNDLVMFTSGRLSVEYFFILSS